MSNEECGMKNEESTARRRRRVCLGFFSTFSIRHSTFDISVSDISALDIDTGRKLTSR
jgi:hypothetical protein